MNWIQSIIGLLSGGATAKIVDGAVNVTAIAALAPLGLWFIHHKDETLTSFTYGQAAIFGLMLVFVLKLAHWTRAPGQ